MKKLEEFPDLKVGDIIRVECDGNIWYELVLGNIRKQEIGEVLYTFISYDFLCGRISASIFITSDTQKVETCELFKD